MRHQNKRLVVRLSVDFNHDSAVKVLIFALFEDKRKTPFNKGQKFIELGFVEKPFVRYGFAFDKLA